MTEDNENNWKCPKCGRTRYKVEGYKNVCPLGHKWNNTQSWRKVNE